MTAIVQLGKVVISSYLGGNIVEKTGKTRMRVTGKKQETGKNVIKLKVLRTEVIS